jgi:hypothetical protein
MVFSPMLGRRVHIVGSVAADPAFASAVDVAAARELVALLVKALVRKGANFVVPVDAEPLRADGLPICFDWLVWTTIRANLAIRPPEAPGPLAVAVQHHKNEEQIPPEHVALWDELRSSQLVRIENAALWNMASKRMEAQARYGDILITLGGTEGVLYLANLYHDVGRPVVPLNLAITEKGEGSRRLHEFGMASGNSARLFRTRGGDSHGWVNRISFPARQSAADRVEALVELLEELEPPTAFAVRLLNEEHADYAAVQEFFDVVVKPVVEGELGYRLAVVDGRQEYAHARIDQEIFARLHRSSLVIADITGARPNCFLEMGYAFGRQLPTIVTARTGSETPFDIATFAGLRWKDSGSADDRRRAFREHIQATRNRPPLVSNEGLIQ